LTSSPAAIYGLCDLYLGVVVLSNSARSVDAIGFRILESISRAPQPVAAPDEPGVERVLKAEASM
jgi:hypothetical protein